MFQEIKLYCKENSKFLLFLVALYLFLTFPLPYYIYTGGGIIPVNKRIQFEEKYTEKGSFNLAYVSEWRGTIATMLLSKVHSDWEVVPKEEYALSTDDSEEDIFFREKIALEEANQNALLLAYQKAGKKYQVKKKNFYVLYVEEKEKAPLKVGDIIRKVEGVSLESIADYRKVIAEKAVGESITLTIEREGKEQEVSVEVFTKENQKLTGLSIKEIDEIKTEPPMKIQFKATENGPSGGLMTALAVYNRITKKDLTNGKTIVGTGTIDQEGNVGEIGGVIYKLQGAVKAKADIFLVPQGDNYRDCQKQIKEKHYPIQLIAVSTFDEAIAKLEKMIS